MVPYEHYLCVPGWQNESMCHRGHSSIRDLSYATITIYPIIVAIQEQDLHPPSTSGPSRLCCHISQV